MSTPKPTTTPILDDRDWSLLAFGERVMQLEMEGYVVLPGLLTGDQVAQLKHQTAQLPTRAVDYSPHQRGCPGVQFHGGAVTELIANPPAVEFLEKVFGDDLILMSYDYARSEPGHPGVSFHTDGQPYGSTIFGAKHTCPVMVRVLYYLDDLTPEVSPFRVIPRSHLSMHSDGNPYHRYGGHPEEVMVTAKTGSAVLINYKVFHGNYPNRGDRAREMLALAYRPAWPDRWPRWKTGTATRWPSSRRPCGSTWATATPAGPTSMSATSPRTCDTRRLASTRAVGRGLDGGPATKRRSPSMKALVKSKAEPGLSYGSEAPINRRCSVTCHPESRRIETRQGWGLTPHLSPDLHLDTFFR